ncbi:MAG: helix-turn-helix transcriptional regulator [Clostridia bacterium]|nr:helix-turn-helix transcriptional regulator [Clostridia bacterium]
MKYCIHNEILRMQNYMRKHYWEPIGVEDVAKSVGYSPRRCNLLFKTCCGETLGEYLKTLRMEDAKRSLNSKTPIDRVAMSLSYTPRGFRKAFQEYFGISPSQYVAGEKTCETYVKNYEYTSEGNWGEGKNPTPDGLWEFACYDPSTKEYLLMNWSESQGQFLSPLYNCRTSPQWYCRNRGGGYGMHPGRATHAVKTFVCPEDGEVEILFSVGRNYIWRRRWSSVWKSYSTPCSAQLYLNDVPLGNALVMETVDPVFLKASCSVRAGDRIQVHIDPMEDHKHDGVVFYRQKISYTSIAEDSHSENCESI